MDKITEDKFIELLATIQGSNESLTTICRNCDFEEEDLTDEQLQRIDDDYTHCPNCGWWVESYEMIDEESCTNCFEPDDED